MIDDRDTHDLPPFDDEDYGDTYDDGEAAVAVEEEDVRPLLGRVAVVGYPNVGKSTLVNRLSGTRQAIVHETPGVTRDRKEIECEWNGERFLLVDTGGVDMGDPAVIARQIVEQAKQAIAECDLVLFVVDGAAGMSAADEELAEVLREARVETMLLANKIDNVKNEPNALEFYALGLGDPLPVSGHHGNNTGDLLDEVVTRLKARGTAFTPTTDRAIRIAVLGRPNVGKSTLVNAMLGNERVIVSEVAGTTRDAIDTKFEFEGREIVLVDTAGIRRKGINKNRPAVEFYGEVRALQAAERADVALVRVDASDALRESDYRIADEARQRDCATIMVLNKWDVNDMDLGDVQATLQQKLRQRPEVVTSSGLTGRNVQRLLQKAIELYEKYSHRVSTGELNRYLGELKDERQGPLDKRSKRRLNLLYGTQYQAAPPKFRIFVNDEHLVTRDYGFWLENRIRERFGFEGTPLIIDFRSRS
jgi:GTPase